MNAIDFAPLYRSTVGFDRLASVFDNAVQQNNNGYPPYDIESVDENEYTITLAVAGFSEDELSLQTERGVLTVSGKQADSNAKSKYLHRGIAKRAFERKFELADHVEVTGADLVNGLLKVTLVKEVPEAMKPKRISIGSNATSEAPERLEVA